MVQDPQQYYHKSKLQASVFHSRGDKISNVKISENELSGIRSTGTGHSVLQNDLGRMSCAELEAGSLKILIKSCGKWQVAILRE